MRKVHIFFLSLSLSLAHTHTHTLKLLVSIHLRALNFTFVRHNVNRDGIVMSIRLLAVILDGKHQHQCKTLYLTIFFARSSPISYLFINVIKQVFVSFFFLLLLLSFVFVDNIFVLDSNVESREVFSSKDENQEMRSNETVSSLLFIWKDFLSMIRRI